MPLLAIVFGGLLTALGLIGFIVTGSHYPTALIPAIAGTLLEFCGGLAMNPKFRMHAMHGAAMIGLLGFLGTLGGVFSLIRWGMGTPPDNQPAVISKSIMSGLCLIFLILCIRSFITARRNREAAVKAG